MVQDQAENSMLAQLVDLKTQLDLDREQDSNTLRRRDREIGRDLSGLTANPSLQLRQWLRRVRIPPDSQHGEHAVVAYRMTRLALFGLGLLLGSACAAAVFHYDGTRPVNVVTVLAFFVGLQLLLLALLGVAMLPRKLASAVPGLGSLQQMLGVLSPGRLMSWFGRILPRDHRDQLGQVLAFSTVYGNVGKWGVLLGSQLFALAFNLGALATCLYLVVFTDLAFGWSTTLQTNAQGFHSLVVAIAAPWSHWFSEGVPTSELVASTRYFRIEPGIFANPSAITDIAALGKWWPFLVAAMTCYGLLPRLAATLIAGWRLRVAMGSAFTHMPGAAQVLDRMNSEFIETVATPGESDTATREATTARRSTIAITHDNAWIISWAGLPLSPEAISSHLRETFQIVVQQWFEAGGTHSIEHDTGVIQGLVQAPSQSQLIILVKAWEPPLMELVDFLVELRQALPRERPLIVVPISIDESGTPGAPTVTQSEIWRRKIHNIGDPWIDIGLHHPTDSDG